MEKEYISPELEIIYMEDYIDLLITSPKIDPDALEGPLLPL